MGRRPGPDRGCDPADAEKPRQRRGGRFRRRVADHEKRYLPGKFARVALRTANIDYNGRFCTSSAAAASIRSLGIDRGPPFPVEDIAGAQVVLLVGDNPAETMPPMMQYFDDQRANDGR